MAVKIIGTTSDQEVDVDTSSKSLKVTYLDTDNTTEFRNRTYAGTAAVFVRQTATTGAGAVVWAMYNPTSIRTIAISQIDLQCVFSGTSAATLMKYEIVKVQNVVSVTAGTIVTPMAREDAKVSTAVIRTLDTGLTVAVGSVDAGVWGNIVLGRISTTTNAPQNKLSLANVNLQSAPIILQENEGLFIRQTATSVIGDCILGSIQFREYV